MLFGSRAGFGLEFHVERDPGLLCVDVFVGGLHVNSWDNAFYPPLLVKKLTDELGRFRAPVAAPAGFVSPEEAFRVAEAWTYDDAREGAELGRCAFLEWGECTDGVLAFAFPDGDRVHLACRTSDATAVVSLSRAVLVETLEQGLVVAEREWAVRLAAIVKGGS